MENEKNSKHKILDLKINSEEYAIDFKAPPILSHLPNQFVRVKNIRRTKRRRPPSKEFIERMIGQFKF